MSSRLAVRASEDTGPNEGVRVKVEALAPDDGKVSDIPLHADLFHVATKTVKEQIAPFVYRYRNTDRFTKVASQETKAPGELLFPVEETGRYVVAVNAPGIRTPLVSDETTVTGEQKAELPVENETSFQIDHRAEPFTPGETASPGSASDGASRPCGAALRRTQPWIRATETTKGLGPICEVPATREVELIGQLSNLASELVTGRAASHRVADAVARSGRARWHALVRLGGPS